MKMGGYGCHPPFSAQTLTGVFPLAVYLQDIKSVRPRPSAPYA